MTDFYSDPRIIRGIMEAAAATGADPLDLATVLSYESAGTMNPLVKGPTTKWGSHEGLLQFGDPQGVKFGADFSSVDKGISSQLGANGAIAKYLKASGYKPGMGMLDLYSTVNAGGPGLYNRSDTKYGGAPGDVGDKVESSAMRAHRAKAERMMARAQGMGPDQSWKLHPELSPAGGNAQSPGSILHPELSPAGPQPGSPAAMGTTLGIDFAGGMGEGLGLGAAGGTTPLVAPGMNPFMSMLGGFGKMLGAGRGKGGGGGTIAPSGGLQDDPGRYAAAASLMQQLLQQNMQKRNLGVTLGA